MKKLVPILLGLFVLGPVHAQLAQQIPKYFGFYILNIPDFVWVEGASVQASSSATPESSTWITGTRRCLFRTTRDPVPLTLNQASSLLMMADAKKPFDLIGVREKAGHRWVVEPRSSSLSTPKSTKKKQSDSHHDLRHTCAQGTANSAAQGWPRKRRRKDELLIPAVIL